MTLYQGFAQQKGFDPIDIPDPSAKILAQGRDQIAGMERALAANRQAAAETVRDLERRSQIERENRESNFRLKMEYRDFNAKARWKQFETEIKNEEIRQKNRQVKRQELINLVKFVGSTGIKAARSLEARRKEDIDEFAYQLYERDGIGLKKFNQIREIDSFTWNDQTAKEGVLARLDLQGIDDKTLNRIRRSGGYASLRVAELSALRLARQRLGIYRDNWNTKFEIAGQEVDFASVTSEHVDELFRQVDAKYRQEFGEHYPSSNIMFSSGAHEIVEQARVEIRKEISNREDVRAKAEQHDDEIETIRHQIGRNNGMGRWSGAIGIQSAIYHYAGGEDAPRELLVRSRHRVVAAVVHGLKTGQITWEDVEGLKDLSLNVRGQKDKVKWGEHFKPEWNKIAEAAAEASRIQNEEALLGSKFRRNEDLFMLEQMKQLEASGETVTPDTWTKFLQVADNKGFDETSDTRKYIIKQLATGQNEDNNAAAEALLRARAARNEIITDDEIDKLQMSDEARAAAKALARKHNQFLPQQGEGGTAERLETIITAELEDIIPRRSAWDKNASHDDAAKGAFEIASGHYRTAVETEGMSHEKAYEYARDQITRIIRDPDGDFAKGGPPGNRGHKGYIADPNREMIRTDTDYLHSVLRLEPTRVSSEPLLAETDVRAKLARLSKGLRTNVMPRAELIRSVTGIKHLDLLLGQREYYANKEIAETGATTIPEVPEWYIKEATIVEDYVGPNAQRLLDTYLPSKVNQAFLESGSDIPYVSPVVDKAKPIAQSVSGGDYNSLGDMSSLDTLGFTLTGSTIRQAILVAEEFMTIGAYQLSSEQIESAAEKGGISLDTLFTSETQDKLFQVLLKSGSWAPPVIEDEQQAFLLNDIQEKMTGNTPNKWGFNSPSLLNSKAYNWLYNEEMAYATA